MKKFKKNISKTIFASFFVFQFIVSTSFMPLVASAEETKIEEPAKEESVEVAVEEVAPATEEVEILIEDIKDLENFVSEEQGIDTENTVEDVTTEEVKISEEHNTESFNSIGDENQNKIHVCHATGSESNPFIYVYVNESANPHIQNGVPESGHEDDFIVTDLNNDGEINVNDCNYNPTQGTFVDANLKVCKVIINENGEMVTDWSVYSGSTFGTTLTLENQTYNFSFDSQDVPQDLGNGTFAVCEDMVGSVAWPRTDIPYLTYSQEIIGGQTQFIANYFEGDAQGEGGLYNPQGGAMFGEFTIEDAAYDGSIDLNCGPNAPQCGGVFNATLFLVNEEVKNDSTKGSIRVCKVIIDKDFMIVEDWSTLPGSNTFAINFLGKPETLNSSFDEAGIPSPVVFDTAIDNTNTSLFGSKKTEASCFTLENLDIGGYFYDREIIAGDNLSDWQIRAYHDGFTGPVDELSDISPLSSFTYDDTLFTSGDNTRRMNSDGHIVLTNQYQNRTLIVINRYLGDITGPSCDVPSVYARVNLTNLPNAGVFGKTNPGWGNAGIGNMAPKIYVGGTNSLPNENGGNVYDVGEWFPVYVSGSGYFNDPNLTANDPGIDGLAVQRLNGQLRIVLYGSHAQSSTSQVINREMANGFIEFSNDQLTVSSDVTIVGQIVDAQNPLESNPNAPIDYPTNDYMSFTSTKSNFKFVVTTHNDGMYTIYTHTLPDEDCDNGGKNTPPVIKTADVEVCLPFDLLTGVIAEDAEDGDITENVIIVNDGGFSSGAPGIYSIVYRVTDNDGAFVETTRLVTIKSDCDNGGGDEDEPTLTVPENSCIETNSTESINLLDGVSGTDSNGDTLTAEELAEIEIVITLNGEVVTSIDFTEEGVYEVTYTFTDAFLNTVTVTRTITIDNDCDNGGNGGDGGNGGGGGGSSSGSRRDSSDGEVLGATSCVAFTTYNRSGNRGGEIKALQTFLNLYMNAGLTVDGVYGATTVQAVHDFQAFHWKEVIDPWTPPLSPNTTGWQYKTTRMTINAIIDCPEAPVYLEDPGVMYQVLEVTDQNELTEDEMQTIYNLLAEAQSGNVLGASAVNSVDYSNPNFDLMFGK